MVAQIAALDHPSAFWALTLAGTRAVAPGKSDADLPDHDKATMKRKAVAEFAAARAEILGDDLPARWRRPVRDPAADSPACHARLWR